MYVEVCVSYQMYVMYVCWSMYKLSDVCLSICKLSDVCNVCMLKYVSYQMYVMYVCWSMCMLSYVCNVCML